MYISDTNFKEAIDNLEDCMFALKSMNERIRTQGYATDEDLEYIEPRFTEALRYMLTLNAHKTHYTKFRDYIDNQDEHGTQIYEALGIGNSVGSIVEHFGEFLYNVTYCRKAGS
tara:strand:+ start:1216 stop:1557 length:342 start_codon:yes stop_codon:yes gene_type:complete